MSASPVVFGFLGRLLLSIVVVAAILLLATPMRDALASTAQSLWRWPEVRTHLRHAAGQAQDLVKRAEAGFERLKSKPATETRQRIAEIDRELDRLSHAPQLTSTAYLDQARLLLEGQLERALSAELQRRVLVQERAALQELAIHLDLAAGTKALEEQVEALDAHRRAAKQREIAAEQRVISLKASGWCRLPLGDCAENLDKAMREWREANADAWRTFREWDAANALLHRTRALRSLPAAATFRADVAGLQAWLDSMSNAVDRVAAWQVTALQPIVAALQSAVYVVAAALVAGFVFKWFFYCVLAPIAERRPPMYLRKDANWSGQVVGGRSVLSLEVQLISGDELIAVGDRLQSIGHGARTRTKWVLSARHPLTSLFSGLWMLTRVRPQTSCPVVLSATTDPLEELNTITLKAGDALVVLPRHVVGVIGPVGRPFRMRSRWKFGLHALLTLQFRYLVMEGPCTLVVAGCRGIRIESAERGRQVSQAMTVGFSANLAYSVARSETFVAYLVGQRPLFNDRFEGQGVLLYQEVPSTAQRRGFTGRGLQGVLDGAMKAFGL